MVATLIFTFVSAGILNFQMSFKDVCTKDAQFGFTCPGHNTFFTSAVFWGTLSPKRLFGPGRRYNMMLLGFPIGIMLPLGEFSCASGCFKLTPSPLASPKKIPKIGIIATNPSRHDPVSPHVLPMPVIALTSSAQAQLYGVRLIIWATSGRMSQWSGSPGNISDENTPVSGQNTTLSLLLPSPPVLLSLLSSFSSPYNSLPVVFLSSGGETL
jgi:hypothetical protein